MSKKLSTQYVQDHVDVSDAELARLAPIVTAAWAKEFAGEKPTDQELRAVSVWLDLTNVLPQDFLVQDFVQAIAENPDMTTAFSSLNPNMIVQAVAHNSGGIVVNGSDIVANPTAQADLADRFQGLVQNGTDSASSDSGTGTATVVSKSKGSVGVVGGLLIYTAIAAIVVLPLVVVGGVVYGGTKLVKKAAED